MIKTSRLLFQKKTLSFLTITGSCGGLYVVIITHVLTESYLLTALISFFIYTLCGIIIGTLAILKYHSPKNILLKLNINGDLIFIKQKIFLLAIFAVVSAFYAFNTMSIGYRILISLFSGVVFILGLSGGIYDQFNNSTKKSLMLGIIPLSIGSLFIFYGSAFDEVIIWISGLLYLFSALLSINRIQLFSKLLGNKDINIKNSRKIRRFNFNFVSILFLGFIAIIFFRNILSSFKGLFSFISNRIYLIFSKFTLWLYRNPYDGTQPPDELDRWENPGQSSIVYYILLVIIILVSIFVITLLLTFAVKALGNLVAKASKQVSINDEYVDEFEIIKTKEHLFRRKKLKYTKAGLAMLIEKKEKIRYLYGFILERLYLKKFSIKTSNTPQEILETILCHKEGCQLEKLGFQNLTEIYRQVRYGNKDIEIPADIIVLAAKYEKVISEISTD